VTLVIDIRLLGPVEVDVDGRALTVDTRKAIALLAYVSVLRRPVSRETLTTLLWPDSSDHDGRGALRRTLSVLRSGLGSSGLSVSRTTVEIDPDAVRVDLDRFRSLVNTARSHTHIGTAACSECRTTLEGAVAIARGPFMEGFSLRDSETFDEWQSAEREVYQRELAGALERLVGEQIAASAWERAISSGQRWLGLDALHEPAHRALMEAYARSGESAAAIRQYRDAVAILDRELGVAPLPETSELNEAIQAGALTAQPAPLPPEPSVFDRSAAARTLPLIDRTAELARLRAALADSAREGRLVVIEGEAGIGKTRIADHLTEIATPGGFRVVEARCFTGESGIAFAPVVALLRARLASDDGAAALADMPIATRAALAALLPEIATAHPDTPPSRSRPAARLALLEGIAAGLVGGAAAERPLVLRLDDVQWADESTLECLAYLARRLHGHSALLLLSWRREELPDHAARIVAAARPPTGEIVRLGRLDPTATRALITTVAERIRSEIESSAADDLVAESEGLPLYVVEALATVDREPGAAPAGIRALLQSRLAGLSQVATQMVAAASVIGRSFDLDIARLVSGRSEDETVEALEELVQRGIVRDGGRGGPARYDFAHARLREVAYEGTSSARRRLLHKRAAAAYRSHPHADPDHLGRTVRIAGHERDAGRSAEAAATFLDAGIQARKVFANREALDYFETAIALGHPDAARLHEEIGDVLITLGEYPRATAAFEAAAASAPPERLADIEHQLGRIALRRGDAVTAEFHLRAARAALDETSKSSRPTLSRIVADLAAAAAVTGALDRAGSLANEAKDLAQGDAAAEVEAERTVGRVAHERGDHVAARRSLERSRLGSEALNDPIASIAALNALSILAREDGRTAEAIDLAERALETARRTGERHLEAALESNLADAFESDGQRERAMAHLKTSAELYAELRGSTEALEPGIWMLESW
jgi:DNA-binding SARP family transcriptional activator